MITEGSNVVIKGCSVDFLKNTIGLTGIVRRTIGNQWYSVEIPMDIDRCNEWYYARNELQEVK